MDATLTFKLFEAGLLQPPPARNIQVKNMEQIGILRDSKKKKKKTNYKVNNNNNITMSNFL
jgi:hypothetical protein